MQQLEPADDLTATTMMMMMMMSSRIEWKRIESNHPFLSSDTTMVNNAMGARNIDTAIITLQLFSCSQFEEGTVVPVEHLSLLL